MAVYSGKDGSLSFDGTAAARVRNWSLQASVDALETTDLGKIARTYEPGLKSATGSCTIIYHDDNTSLQTVLDNCITAATPAKGVLRLSWGSKYVSFTVLVAQVALGCTTGEVMSADISFTMDGDYTGVAL